MGVAHKILFTITDKSYWNKKKYTVLFNNNQITKNLLYKLINMKCLKREIRWLIKILVTNILINIITMTTRYHYIP